MPEPSMQWGLKPPLSTRLDPFPGLSSPEKAASSQPKPQGSTAALPISLSLVP